MKRLLLILMGASLLCSEMASGAESAGPVNVKEYTREAGKNLRGLPKITREAWLAQQRGLLFCEDGRSPYTGATGTEKVTIKRGKKVETHRNSFKEVRREAVFIGTDGQLYNFRAVCDQHSKDARKADKWKAAGFYTSRAGEKAALAPFTEELQALEVQRGIYFLKQMRPELRAALFAEVLGLLYLDNGGDAYTGQTCYSTIGGERVPYQGYREGAKFVDAQGKAHSIAQVRAEENERGKAWRTWWPGVKLNMHRAGQDAILAPFKAEIKAMKEHAAK